MSSTPTRISYVNGRYVPHNQAAVHIEDRGYQFSDGIYEVMLIENNVMIDRAQHWARLKRSLAEMRIAFPVSIPALEVVTFELLRRNRLKSGCIYLQITRGVAKRDHPFPKKPVEPAIVMTVTEPKTPSLKERTEGVHAITYPDIRWLRRDIKSISLLPNVLAKQAATEAKVREAWLYTEKGIFTEGSSTNIYIVDAKGTVITHPANEMILGGVTRDSILKLAKKAGIKVLEKPFTLADIKKAKEAFLTSTTAMVLPVVKIDRIVIGSGKPGKIVTKLQSLYAAHISNQAKKKH